jgi:predicted amidohydrolase
VIRIAAVQHGIVWEDPEANYPRYADHVARAAGRGADLVVFSEMFTTGFSMDSARLAEPPFGPTVRFLTEQAARHAVWVGGSIAERTEGHDRPTNRFILAGPTGEIHRYSKVHPFSYSGEDEHYSAGETTITVAVKGVNVTPFVCYDLRFADLFWDAAEETDCYLVIANWPASRRGHWSALLRARAIENQAYVVGVNRIGTDGNDLSYAGDSAIFDPMGEELAATHDDVETIIDAVVDPDHVLSVRARFPFLSDRRPQRPAPEG